MNKQDSIKIRINIQSSYPLFSFSLVSFDLFEERKCLYCFNLYSRREVL